MSACGWRRFVRMANSEVLRKFGSHIARRVDYERNKELRT